MCYWQWYCFHILLGNVPFLVSLETLVLVNNIHWYSMNCKRVPILVGTTTKNTRIVPSRCKESFFCDPPKKTLCKHFELKHCFPHINWTVAVWDEELYFQSYHDYWDEEPYFQSYHDYWDEEPYFQSYHNYKLVESATQTK